MYRFEKLEIWIQSVKYSKRVYKLTGTFPKEEIFGLISQLRRAAVSISSNIAEGSGSSTNKDFCYFLDIAIKSTLETVSQLLLAKELGFIKESQVEDLYVESEILIKKMRAFKDYLSKPHAPASNPQPTKGELYG